MKSFLFALVGALALAGCGSSGYTLSSGSYTISSVSAPAEDDGCNLGIMLENNDVISVTVAADAVSIVIDPSKVPAETPATGSISGDEFTTEVSKNLDIIGDTNCQDKWTRKITGTLTASDSFDGTFEFTDTTISGSDCSDASKIEFTPPSCTTKFTFKAVKK